MVAGGAPMAVIWVIAIPLIFMFIIALMFFIRSGF
jgi:hypothetical protein